MSWSTAADVATTLGVLGGFLALWNFVHTTRTRRAEWLLALHEQFFEQNRYDTVRQVLDYDQVLKTEYLELRRAVEEERNNELVHELYRYLNFFELLASLKQLRQITHREILALFEYDLRMIKRHRFIMEALRPQGFEHLSELLVRLEESRS